MESLGHVIETITFNTNIEYALWVKKESILTDELLSIRLCKDKLTFIKHNNYICPSLYYRVNNVDSSHGSFEIELPNVTEETDMKRYFKVRNKLISRAKSIINKHFKSEL